VLRRPPSTLDPVLTAGNVAFDPSSRQVWVADAEIHVPRREACLLEVLLRSFERTVPKSSLEESLYGFDDEVSPNAIEVGVYRLRTHLQKAGATVAVRTARGVGYVLERAEGAGAASEG
jgi:two-component system, OmpR family, response regulator